MTRRSGVIGLAAVILAAAGCAAGRGGARASPPPSGPPALPAIPERTGPLRLYVAYPDSLARIAVSDSNFLFGTTGTGRAELTVNGQAVPVQPNGAFLAWLPVPEPTSGDTVVYRLLARSPAGADTLVHRVLVPRRPGRGRKGAWIDSAAAGVMPERWARPRDGLLLGVRAAPAGEARLRVAGREWELPEVAPGRYEARIEARALAADSGAGSGLRLWSGPPEPGRATDLAAADTAVLRYTVAVGADTATAVARLPFRLLAPAHLPFATLVETPDPVHGRAGRVAARPTPYGSFAWLLVPGSGAPIEAREGDRVRLRMGDGLRAWVASEDTRVEAVGRAPAPASVGVGGVAASRTEEGVRIRIPVERRLPAHVRAVGPRSLELVVPGGLGETERMALGSGEWAIRALEWEQMPGPRWVLRVETEERVWGWSLGWADADSAPPPASESGALLLEVRRPPRLDSGRPLAGVRIALDPGHPPGGSEGPTGLTEAEANLAVARRLAERLRAAGATPVLVREDSAPVGLYERRRRAREAGADLLISLHNNALPDGVRPFGAEGTSTYYFHRQALPLARAVQRGLLATLGLRDLGVRWGNLALPRESWMPTVLVEGAFMMFPRHEAALRTPEFRDAYAAGVEEGLRAFLGEVARERTAGGAAPGP